MKFYHFSHSAMSSCWKTPYYAYMGKQGGTGPQNTNWSQRLLSTKKNVDRRKSRNTNSYTNFFGAYELEIRNRSQIRIRIYVLDVFAVKIRIGPLIFSPIRRIRGGGTVPPALPMYVYDCHKVCSKGHA